MQAFQPLPSAGWASRVEPQEATLLAGIFSELSDAMEAEEKRDVLDMMGVNLDGDTPKHYPLMFEKLLGVDQVSSIASREELPEDGTSGEAEPLGRGKKLPSEEGPVDPQALRRADKPANGPSEPNAQGLTDEQRLAELDFDPLSTRPAPANPYIAAILRPMSKDSEEAAELRALTTPDLAAKKTAAMRVVAAGLTWAAEHHSPVVVKPDTLKVWVTAINDARLALGWSLGIEDDMRAEEVQLMAESDPKNGIYTAYEITIASIYNALSWWLETLMYAVMGSEAEVGE